MDPRDNAIREIDRYLEGGESFMRMLLLVKQDDNDRAIYLKSLAHVTGTLPESLKKNPEFEALVKRLAEKKLL